MGNFGVTISANVQPLRTAFQQIATSTQTVVAAFAALNRGGNNAFAGIQQQMNNIHYTVRNTTSAINGFSGSMIAAIKTPTMLYTEFERSLLMYAAVTRNLGETVKLSSERIQTAKMLFLELGKSSIFSAQQVATAAIELARLGFTAKQVEQSMGGIINAATAAGIGIEQAATLVAGAIRGFRLSAEDSMHVADLLAVAANKSAAGFGDLAYAFKYVGPAAAAAGQSIEDITGLLSLLANNMIRGTQAGNSLQNMISRLQKPPRQAAEALDKLNLAVNEGGRMRNFVDILRDMRDKFSGLDQATQAATIKVIAGEEALSAMSAIVNTSNKEFEDYISTMQNVDGESEKAAQTMKQGLFFAMEQLKESVTTLGILFGESFSGSLRMVIGFLQKFTEVVEKIPKEMKDFIAGVLVVTALVSSMSIGIMLVVGSVTSAASSLLILAGAFRSVATNATLFPMFSRQVGIMAAAFGRLLTLNITAWFGSLFAWFTANTAAGAAFSLAVNSATASIDAFIFRLALLIGGTTALASLVVTMGVTIAAATVGIFAFYQIWSDWQKEVIAKNELEIAQSQQKTTLMKLYKKELEEVNAKIKKDTQNGGKADIRDLEKRVMLTKKLGEYAPGFKKETKDNNNREKVLLDKIKESQEIYNKAKERNEKISLKVAEAEKLIQKYLGEGKLKEAEGLKNMVKRLKGEEDSNKNTMEAKRLLTEINKAELHRNELLNQRRQIENGDLTTEQAAARMAEIDKEINASLERDKKELKPQLATVLGIDTTEEDDKARKDRLDKYLEEFETKRRKNEQDFYDFKAKKEKEYQDNVQTGLENQREYLMNYNEIIPAGRTHEMAAQEFGASRDHGKRTHKGQDFGAAIGSRVNSAFSGKVISAGWEQGYGKAMRVEHANGIKTLYAHLSEFIVKKGDQVAKGQQIAKSGNTGAGTGQHLHFEIIQNGVQVDPDKFIGNSVSEFNPEQRKQREFLTKQIEQSQAMQNLIQGKINAEGNKENKERLTDELNKEVDRHRDLKEQLAGIDTDAMQERIDKAQEERDRILQILDEIKSKRINVELEAKNIITKLKQGEVAAELERMNQELDAYRQKVGNQTEIEKLKVAMIEKIHTDMYAKIEEDYKKTQENMQGFMLSGFDKNVIKIVQEMEKKLRDINAASAAKNPKDIVSMANDINAISYDHLDNKMNSLGLKDTWKYNFKPKAPAPPKLTDKTGLGANFMSELKGSIFQDQGIASLSDAFASIGKVANMGIGNAFHEKFADTDIKTKDLMNGKPSAFVSGANPLLNMFSKQGMSGTAKTMFATYSEELREILMPETEKYYKDMLDYELDLDQTRKESNKQNLDMADQLLQKAEQYGLLSKDEFEYRKALIDIEKENMLKKEQLLSGERLSAAKSAMSEAMPYEETKLAQARDLMEATAAGDKKAIQTALQNIELTRLTIQTKILETQNDYNNAVMRGDNQQAVALQYRLMALRDIGSIQKEIVTETTKGRQIDNDIKKISQDRNAYAESIMGYETEIASIKRDQANGSFTELESLGQQLEYLSKKRSEAENQLDAEKQMIANGKNVEEAKAREAKINAGISEMNEDQIAALYRKAMLEGDLTTMLVIQNSEYDNNFKKLQENLKLVNATKDAWGEVVTNLAGMDNGLGQIVSIVKFIQDGLSKAESFSANFSGQMEKQDKNGSFMDQIMGAAGGLMGDAAGAASVAGPVGAVATAVLAISNAMGEANKAAIEHRSRMVEMASNYREVQLEIIKTRNEVKYLTGEMNAAEYGSSINLNDIKAIDNAIAGSEEKIKAMKDSLETIKPNALQGLVGAFAGMAGLLIDGPRGASNFSDFMSGGYWKNFNEISKNIEIEQANKQKIEEDKKKYIASQKGKELYQLQGKNSTEELSRSIDPRGGIWGKQIEEMAKFREDQESAMIQFSGTEEQRIEFAKAQQTEATLFEKKQLSERMVAWNDYFTSIEQGQMEGELNYLSIMRDSSGKRIAQIELEAKKKKNQLESDMRNMVSTYGDEAKDYEQYKKLEFDLFTSEADAERKVEQELHNSKIMMQALELDLAAEGFDKRLELLKREQDEGNDQLAKQREDYKSYLAIKYKSQMDAAGAGADVMQFASEQEKKSFAEMLRQKELLDGQYLIRRNEMYQDAIKDIRAIEQSILSGSSELTSDGMDDIAAELSGKLNSIQNARDEVYRKYAGNSPEDIAARAAADKDAMIQTQVAYKGNYTKLREYAMEYNNYRRETAEIEAAATIGLEDDMLASRQNTIEKLMQEEAYELAEFGDNAKKKAEIEKRFNALRLKAAQDLEKRLADLTVERYDRIKTLREEQLRQDKREYELQYREHQDDMRMLEQQRRDLERQKQMIVSEIERLKKNLEDNDTSMFNSDLASFNMDPQIRAGLQLISNPTDIANSRVTRATQKEALDARTQMLQDEAEANRELEVSTDSNKTALQDYVDKMKEVILTRAKFAKENIDTINTETAEEIQKLRDRGANEQEIDNVRQVKAKERVEYLKSLSEAYSSYQEIIALGIESGYENQIKAIDENILKNQEQQESIGYDMQVIQGHIDDLVSVYDDDMFKIDEAVNSVIATHRNWDITLSQVRSNFQSAMQGVIGWYNTMKTQLSQPVVPNIQLPEGMNASDLSMRLPTAQQVTNSQRDIVRYSAIAGNAGYGYQGLNGWYATASDMIKAENGRATAMPIGMSEGGVVPGGHFTDSFNVKARTDEIFAKPLPLAQNFKRLMEPYLPKMMAGVGSGNVVHVSMTGNSFFGVDDIERTMNNVMRNAASKAGFKNGGSLSPNT